MRRWWREESIDYDSDFEPKKEEKAVQTDTMYEAAILDLDNKAILAKFKDAKTFLDKFKATDKFKTRFSLGVPANASIPHSILNAFRNLVAVSAATEWSFTQAATMIEAAKNAPLEPILLPLLRLLKFE